jgi:hypothetical protein
MGQRGTGKFHFGEEKFPVEICVDTTDAADPFLELTHQTRDWREGDRVVRDTVRLARVSTDRQADDGESLGAQQRIIEGILLPKSSVNLHWQAYIRVADYAESKTISSVKFAPAETQRSGTVYY